MVHHSKTCPPMTEMGHSLPGQTKQHVQPCPLFADRYRNGEPLKPTRRANNGSHQTYSITSSAVASTNGGMVRPSVLAVLRLMTRSNFVGCSMGMSAGFAPFSILST